MPTPKMFFVKLIVVIVTLVQYTAQYSISSEVLNHHSIISILQTMLPNSQNSACHIVLLNEFPSLGFFHQDFHHQILTTEIITSEKTRSISVHSYKHSPACLHVLVPGSELISAKRNWHHGNLFGLRQSRVHYLVIGDESQLRASQATEVVSQLKYKTGFDPKTGRWTDFDSPGFIIWFSDSYRSLPTDTAIARTESLRFGLWKLGPYVTLDEDGNPNGGITYQPLKELAEHYNLSFSYDINLKSLGKDENGEWKGYMHDLTKGNTEGLFGTGPILLRHGHVEFSTCSLYFHLKFVTSHPEVSIQWSAVIHPFDSGTWTLVLCTCTFTILILYLQLSLKRGPDWDTIANDSLYKAIVFPFATLLQESVDLPRNAKLIAIFFSFFSIIIGTCYNSNLISFLTLPDPEKVPRTFEELAAMRHKYHIILQHNPGSTQTLFFEQTQNPDMLKIKQVMEYAKVWSKCPIDAGAKKRTACIGLSLSIEPYRYQNLSLSSTWNPYVESRTSAVATPVTMAMRLNSKHFDFFNLYIGLFRDTGHFTKWKLDAFEYVRKRSVPWLKDQIMRGTEFARSLQHSMASSQGQTIKPFGLKNFVLCFFLLGIGLALSFIVCFGEMIYTTKLHQRQQMQALVML